MSTRRFWLFLCSSSFFLQTLFHVCPAVTRVAATEGKKEEAEASQWGGGGRSSHGTTARLFAARRFSLPSLGPFEGVWGGKKE